MIVLNVDMPFIMPETIMDLVRQHEAKSAAVTVLSAKVDDPTGYGRIIRNGEGFIEKIVEQKDATDRELAVNEINTGTYCFDCRQLFAALKEITSGNAQKEYYLTDTVEILKRKNLLAAVVCMKDPEHSLGINTREHIGIAEKIYSRLSGSRK